MQQISWLPKDVLQAPVVSSKDAAKLPGTGVFHLAVRSLLFSRFELFCLQIAKQADNLFEREHYLGPVKRSGKGLIQVIEFQTNEIVETREVSESIYIDLDSDGESSQRFSYPKNN